MTFTVALEPAGGERVSFVPGSAEGTQVPVEPVIVPPPEVLSVTEGEALGAHHAGRTSVLPGLALLIVDSLEGELLVTQHLRRLLGEVDELYGGPTRQAVRIHLELVAF